MNAGPPTAGPLLPLHERWKIMQNLGHDDVVYTEHSVMVGKGRRVEISCPNTAIREIEELVLFGKALLQPPNGAKGKPQFQINTIYVIGDEARLECRGVWILARRIVVMSQRHFAKTVDNVLNSPFLPPSEGKVPCDRFSSATFILNTEQEYLHPYKGFDTCIQHGDLPFVQFYLASGENPDVGLIPPLCLAAQHNQAGVVTLLLDAKAHTEAIDQIGTTPLMYAAMHNSADAAKLLIGAGANINARSVLPQTPVSTAANYGSFEVLNLLAAAGADLASHRPTPHSMPAMVLYAAGNGFLATLESLFSGGCSIEVENVFHDTPLTIAAKYGHIGIVSNLLAKKANLKACGADGTALENAVQYNHKEIINLLIQADPEAAREFLLNIRPIEAHKIKNFVLSGPLGNMIGLQALTRAVLNDDYDGAKRLLEAEAIVHYQDAEGMTPLAQARFALQMMNAAEISIPNGLRGQARKIKLARQKANCENLIKLLMQYKAPEGEPVQKSLPPKNKSVQLAVPPDEEICFVAIEAAQTEKDAYEAFINITQQLIKRGYAYSNKEWHALANAKRSNPELSKWDDVETLKEAVNYHDATNARLLRQDALHSQREITSEHKNKGMQLTDVRANVEEISFIAIETAETVEAASAAITKVTDQLNSRGYGYSCAEWLALRGAIENNSIILPHINAQNLLDALGQNDSANKRLPRKNRGQSQSGQTGEQKTD